MPRAYSLTLLLHSPAASLPLLLHSPCCFTPPAAALPLLPCSGGTNIWGGLQQALEAVERQQQQQRPGDAAANAAVVLLTDGEPTTHKPEEIVLLLRSHLLGRPAAAAPAAAGGGGGGGLAGTLHTVGYGYSLDSAMLTELGEQGCLPSGAPAPHTTSSAPPSLAIPSARAASLGHGTFSFVPDGTMVATVFVNLMAYISTSAAPAAAVAVEVRTEA